MAKRTGKAKAAKPKQSRLPKLNPNDENYYSDLGERGGKNTLKNKGPEFFQYIARLSHEARRRNSIKRSNDKRGLPTVY